MLDLKGLLALWRETLALRASIQNNKGWINHPLAIPILRCSQPELFIESYLLEIYKEGLLRNISFKKEKIKITNNFIGKNIVSVSYMKQEIIALHKKISTRDINRYENIKHFLNLMDFQLSDVFIKDVAFLYDTQIFDDLS